MLIQSISFKHIDTAADTAEEMLLTLSLNHGLYSTEKKKKKVKH